jgi:predicted signal transduction protein with EAL and GGDEF domain
MGNPFFALYLFVMVFAALYYSSGIAALVVFLTVLASLGPDLYDPDAARLAEHAMVHVPSYLASVFVCWYMARKVGRRERLRDESERRLGEARELGDRFRREAYTDRLTGLSNRAHFDDLLQKEIKRARRHGERFFLVFFDVDDFKVVNDVRGHGMGDDVLRLLAKILRRNTRETPTPWHAKEGRNSPRCSRARP